MIQDGPDEATEFSGDGSDGDVTVFALVEVPEFFVETILGFEGNGDDIRWLSLAASVEDQVRASPVSVVPGGLEEKASDVDITSFGDTTTILFGAGRALRERVRSKP